MYKKYWASEAAAQVQEEIAAVLTNVWSRTSLFRQKLRRPDGNGTAGANDLTFTLPPRQRPVYFGPDCDGDFCLADVTAGPGGHLSGSPVAAISAGGYEVCSIAIRVFNGDETYGEADCTFGYVGAIIGSDAGHHTKGYLINLDSSIFAVNFATDEGPDQSFYRVACLAAEGQDGDLYVFRSLNRVVARLCAKAHEAFDADSVVVYKLVGNQVFLRSGQPGDTNYLVTLQISPASQLSILSYAVQQKVGKGA